MKNSEDCSFPAEPAQNIPQLSDGYTCTGLMDPWSRDWADLAVKNGLVVFFMAFILSVFIEGLSFAAVAFALSCGVLTSLALAFWAVNFLFLAEVIFRRFFRWSLKIEADSNCISRQLIFAGFLPLWFRQMDWMPVEEIAEVQFQVYDYKGSTQEEIYLESLSGERYLLQPLHREDPPDILAKQLADYSNKGLRLIPSAKFQPGQLQLPGGKED